MGIGLAPCPQALLKKSQTLRPTKNAISINLVYFPEIQPKSLNSNCHGERGLSRREPLVNAKGQGGSTDLTRGPRRGD